ncbi:hypothetical protein C882_3100 [Caenispirillum salinarum AK4]|uniref:Uncharacterized protein n=1 Tax=Caenispirillum salinarum AK4 TaxID=1238182 RepID=K9HUV3_9PROT|nr:hypothetical protein C882_3100 [Caenispirillum salinarum AK4]
MLELVQLVQHAGYASPIPVSLIWLRGGRVIFVAEFPRRITSMHKASRFRNIQNATKVLTVAGKLRRSSAPNALTF